MFFFYFFFSEYYLIDMMIWRCRELYDCTTEFRFFWMHSKLEEDNVNLRATYKKQFIPLVVFPATSSGIQSAYSDPVPFTRDGLYFIHRRTHYSPGQTPLALTWKDAVSSRFFINTDAKGVIHPEQQIVLQYLNVPRRGVCTGDEPAIPLGTMPEQFIEKVGTKLKPGMLLKCILGDGGIQFSSNLKFGIDASNKEQQQEVHPVGADLKFIGVANQRRGRADTLSKILFQMMARRQPIQIEMLTRVASEGENEGLMGVEGQGGESIGIVGRDSMNVDDNRMNE
jgi:snurportin-1